MIDQETENKLLALRLRTMAQVFRELIDKPDTSLTFTEKVGMMVDREWNERDNHRTTRRLKELAPSRKSSPMPAAVSTSLSCARSGPVPGSVRSKT